MSVEAESFVDAWMANCSLNHELLSICTDADLELKPGKGKTIRSNFVHIGGIRRAHLEERMRKECETVPKPDWKIASKEELQQLLTVTDGLMATLIRRIAEEGQLGKWTAPRFFAYNIAHEANHRAQIEIALRLGDREPEVAFLYGLWDWSKRI